MRKTSKFAEWAGQCPCMGDLTFAICTFQILALLLEHAGQVVTREELRQRLWPADTFVEYDHNLNSSVKKLRQALGDDPDNPRFVETLPRRGYRLIVPVTGTVTSSDRVVEEGSVTEMRNKRRPGYYRTCDTRCGDRHSCGASRKADLPCSLVAKNRALHSANQ